MTISITEAVKAGLKLAVAYLRRSTIKQEQSIDDQRREIERHAAAHGFAIIAEYIDEASGTSAAGRKAFQRMIADARHPDCPFRYVLVYDVSRFSRGDNDEAGYYRHLLRKSGVEVDYVSEGFAGDDSDEIVRPVKQSLARTRSIDTSRDTVRGQITTAEGGWWSGGTPPYGYDLEYVDASGKPIGRIRYLSTGNRQLFDMGGTPLRVIAKGERYLKSDGDKVRLAPSTPERVEIVRRIFHLYDQGAGYTAIADQFNRERILSPRNGKYSSKVKAGWAGSTIKTILENRAYVGDIVWNQTTSAKFYRASDNRPVRRSRAEFEKFGKNAECDYVVKENAHPALIDRALFERVKAAQAARRKQNGGGSRSGRRAKSPYLLSGLIECSNCGRNFSGQPQNRGRPKKDGSPVTTRYYMCGGYLNQGSHFCTGLRVPQAMIESFVLEEIGRRVRSFLDKGGEAIARTMVRKALDGGDRFDRQLEALRQRIDTIQDEIDRLLDCITPDTKEEIGKRVRRLREERTEHEVMIARIEGAQRSVVDVEAAVSEIVKQMHAFGEVFEEGTIEEKKAFIALFIEKIAVNAKKGTVRVRIRQFPAPESLDTGNASFRVVAGAGFEPATFGL